MRKNMKHTPLREKFIEAALQRFAINGYAATSTRDICADLGLSHSAIYNYFPSKESLFVAIEEREMVMLQAGLDASLESVRGAPVENRLATAVKFTLGMALIKRKAWRLMADSLRYLKPKNRLLVIATRDRYERTLSTLVEEALRKYNIENQDPRLTTLYLFGIAEGMSGWYQANGRYSADKIANDATNFVFRSLGLSTEGI